MPRLLLLLALLGASTPLQAQSPLRWGGDCGGRRSVRRGRPARSHRRWSGFDVEIAELVARQLGRDAAVRADRVQLARSVRTARRLRHRPERHRGHSRRGGQSLAACMPYYEFREVLTVRDGDRGRFSFARRPARPPRRHAGRDDCLRPAARRPSATTASWRCPTTMTCTRTAIWRSAGWTRCCSTTCWPSGRCGGTAGLFTHPAAVAIGHYIVITAPENTALRDQVDRRSSARRCATARSSASSASGMSGTTISRGSTRVCSRRRRQSRLGQDRWHPGTPPGARRPPVHGPATVSAIAAPGRAHHAGAVLRVDGAGGAARRGDRDRPRLRRARDLERRSPPMSK